MVLEQLFPDTWTKKKLRYALLTGFVYSGISILISYLLFGKNSGLISVILTSLLILPLLENLLKKEERKEEKERKFFLRHLYDDNKEVVITYLFLFISIFFTYALYVFIFHLFKADVLTTFHGQLLLDFSKGGATFMFKDFWTILQNNWWVLLTIFVISLFIKDGGIFFVTWNASSWGVILSYRAITSAGYVGGNAFTFFAIIFMLSGPFLILEGLAYILAAISGNIISKDVVKKTKNVKVFLFYALCGVTLSFIMHLLLNRIQAPVWASILLQMLIICIILGLLSLSFKEKKMKEVFIYNIFLLFIAIGLFIIGALLEALITQNVPVLTAIYSTSSLFIAAVS